MRLRGSSPTKVLALGGRGAANEQGLTAAREEGPVSRSVRAIGGAKSRL